MEKWQQDLIDSEESRFGADMERKREELNRFFREEIPVATGKGNTDGWDTIYYVNCPHCGVHCCQFTLPVLHKCSVCQRWYFVKEEEKDGT